MAEEITLLSCPFCGGKASLMWPDDLQTNQVVCIECFAGSNILDTKQQAIVAWNKRATNDQNS